MTELTHLRQVNSELNAALRVERLIIADLQAELMAAQELLAAFGVLGTADASSAVRMIKPSVSAADLDTIREETP